MRHAHAKEVPVSNPITLCNFFWNLVLEISERDRSWFCPFLDVQDHYLWAALKKFSLPSEAGAPNKLLRKNRLQRRKRKTTLFWFDPREHEGEGKEIKRIKMQAV